MDKGEASSNASSPQQPMSSAQYKQLAAQLSNRQPTLEELDEKDVESSVTMLQLEIAFDNKLKDMASYKRDEDGQEQLNKQERGKVSLLQGVVIFVYFVLMPYIEAPLWCLEYYHHKDERHLGLMGCAAAGAETKVRYANLITLSPVISTLINVLCLGFFCVMACFRTKWQN